MLLDIAWALRKCHLRDYHDDMQSHIDGAHPNFNASMTLLWQDHMPAVTADNQAMSQAENALLAMDDQAAQLGFDQDCLKLATDVAMLGRLFEATIKSDRARHLAKVQHLKHQCL